MLSPVWAQDKDQPFHKKFEVGARIGYLPLNLMRSSDTTTKYESHTPPVQMLARSTDQSRPVTLGPSLVYRISPKWAVGVDAMYRNVGYDELMETKTIVDSGGTSVLYGYTNDRTRASFWDVPVLVRYTRKQQRGWHPKMTGLLGVSTRFVTGIDSYRENVNKQGNVYQTSEPVKPANKMTPGGTAGMGLTWKDEVGVRVSVEGRYTYWMKDVFQNNATAMTRHTVEVLIGFSF
jgi:hypothetical protein